MNNDIFIEEVRRAFDPVAADHGFECAGVDTRVGISVVYARGGIVLDVSSYKGEIDESFHLRAAEAGASSGPYVYGYDVWRYFGANDDGRPLAKWNSTREELRAQLLYDAAMIRKYCTPLLEGDQELFEAVLRMRK